MSDNVTRIGQRVRSVKRGQEQERYTQVVFDFGGENPYKFGPAGRPIAIENPLFYGGNRELYDVCRNLTNRMRAIAYQPYSASGAILDPAAEIGDGVLVNNIYSGIFRMKTIFGRDFRADISAPEEETIDQEYPFISKKDRKVTRQMENLSSELLIQSGLISAKVSRTGGEPSSFGWKLADDSWTIKANGMDVLKATKDGLEVYGKVTATSGAIGGFQLKDNALSTNGQTFGGTNFIGVYLGPDGLQLGTGFKVDAQGNLEATSGTFTGTVHASSIEYGGTAGYFDGEGIDTNTILGNRLKYNTVSTAYTSEGINESLGYANFADSVFNGIDRAAYMDTKVLLVQGVQYTQKEIAFKDYYGNTRKYKVLAVAEE